MFNGKKQQLLIEPPTTEVVIEEIDGDARGGEANREEASAHLYTGVGEETVSIEATTEAEDVDQEINTQI